MHITDELADFLKVEHGTQLSRNDITTAICTYIYNRNGQSQQEWAHLNTCHRNLQSTSASGKIIINPDIELYKLLKVDEYVKDVIDGKVIRKDKIVNDINLYYYVIQKLIQKHITL